MPGALLTDLYELNMAATYLRRGMDADATFSLYVRDVPPERGFLVAAGLEACLDFITSFGFDEADLEHLSTIGFDGRTLDAFRDVRFEGDVWAVPEGRIVTGEEPLLEVTGPIAVAQLLETMLLNQITLHVTAASKAARFRLAARDRTLVDFAFRRTHGLDAGMAVARDSAIVGFAATSNVEAARRYGLLASGTMAHSFVEAFESEADAFKTFAEDFAGNVTFLVDTYDTLNGVRTAIKTIQQLGISRGLAIRLDSGDFDQLSRAAREMLDDDGLDQVRIFASGGLDELEVEALVSSGAPIDAFGIGTQMGVSADAPFVDSVYKLVTYDGRPVLKLSAAKATAPGAKQVFRTEQGDTLGLRDEDLPGERLLVPVVEKGQRAAEPEDLETVRGRFEQDLERLPEGSRRLRDPEQLGVTRSPRLEALAAEARATALRRSGASSLA
jgi:nicotinate phosphoribosyltransferase